MNAPLAFKRVYFFSLRQINQTGLASWNLQREMPIKFRFRRVLTAIALLTLGWMAATALYHPIMIKLNGGVYCERGNRFFYGKEACGL